MERIKVIARQRNKFGGCLVDINILPEIAANMPAGQWEFVSKIKNLPKNLFTQYSMFYNTNQLINQL